MNIPKITVSDSVEISKKSPVARYWWLPFGLFSLIPILLALHVVLHVSANVPFQDEWQLTPFIADYHNGTLTLKSFWQAHNEHRQPAFRLLILGLIALTGYWNVAHETLAGWFVALGTTFLCSLLVFQTVKERLAQVALLMLVVSATFSLNQYENWMVGFQLAWFVVNFSLLATLVLLTYFPGRWYSFAGAVFFTLLGAGTLLNGLLIWLVIFPFLRFSKQWPFRYAFIWEVLAVFFISFYLVDLERLARSSFKTDPVAAGLFLVAWLGAPFTNGNFEWACAIGIIGLVGLAVLAWLSLRHREFSWQSNLPWLAILSFSLVNGLAIADGRALINLHYATISRYTTTAYLFWLGLFVLLVQEIIRLDNQKKLKKVLAYLAGLVIGLSVVQFTVLATFGAAYPISIFERLLRTTEPFLYNYTTIPEEANPVALFELTQLQNYLFTLEKHQEGIFHISQSEYTTRLQNNWDKILKEHNYTELNFPLANLALTTSTGQAITTTQIQPDGLLSYSQAGDSPTHIWLRNVYDLARFKSSWLSLPFDSAGKKPVLEVQAENVWFVRLYWNIQPQQSDSTVLYGLRDSKGVQRFRVFLPEQALSNQFLVSLFYKAAPSEDDQFKIILHNPG